MDWNTFAWLNRGKRRKNILQILHNANRPLTINEIKIISKISISQVSVIISEFTEKKLISCKNPLDKIGKLFEITEEGRIQHLQLERGFSDDP